MKNKKIQIILITLVLLIIGYYGTQYLMYKIGQYIFKTEIINAEEVAGKTDNNEYGIRNDIYDYLQNDLFKNIQFSEEEKIIALNRAYVDQKILENFSNESSIFKYLKIRGNITKCFNSKYKNISNYMIGDTEYDKKLENMESRTMARHVYETIYSKNNEKFWGLPTEDECSLLKTKLLKDID